MFHKSLKLTFLLLFLVSVLQPALIFANDIKANNKDSGPMKTEKKDVITYKSTNPESMGSPNDGVVQSCKDLKYMGLVNSYKSAFTEYVASKQRVKYINGVIDKNADKKIKEAEKNMNSLRYQMTKRYEDYLKESQPVIKPSNTSSKSPGEDKTNAKNPLGTTFVGCGKAWQIGPDGNGAKAEAWVESLGDGWRTPTMAEVLELSKAFILAPKNTEEYSFCQKNSELFHSKNFWCGKADDGDYYCSPTGFLDPEDLGRTRSFDRGTAIAVHDMTR